MKNLNCTKEAAFKSLLNAVETLNWSIIEVDEPSKVTVESPKTWTYNGQRYVISIIGDSPCSLNYSVHGKKVGPITSIPSNKYGEKDMQQLFTLMDAEMGDADDSVGSESANQPKATVDTEEPKPAQESLQTHVKTESKKEAAMRKIQEQQQADKKRNFAVAAGIAVIAIAGFAMSQSGGSSNSSPSTGCSGTGSQNCITEIRSLVTGSGKQIANEAYDGDGVFQISFIDYNRGGELFEATYYMDCDCKPTNVQVRRL